MSFFPESFEKSPNHQNKLLISIFCVGVCFLPGSTVNLRCDPRNATKSLKLTVVTHQVKKRASLGRDQKASI